MISEANLYKVRQSITAICLSDLRVERWGRPGSESQMLEKLELERFLFTSTLHRASGPCGYNGRVWNCFHSASTQSRRHRILARSRPLHYSRQMTRSGASRNAIAAQLFASQSYGCKCFITNSKNWHTLDWCLLFLLTGNFLKLLKRAKLII